MSMTTCFQCGSFCDTDFYPEGYYRDEDGEPSDEYYCQACNEKDW
jgi:hypothetical protein